MPRTDEQMAEAFYPNTPAPQPAPVKQDTPTSADRLFSDQGKPTPQELEARDIVALTRSVSKNLPEGIDHSFSQALEQAATASDQQHKEWQLQVKLEMRKEYGDDAPKLLEEANTIIARNPKLRAVMRKGIGNHPAVISRFVGLALAERKARK